MELGTTANRTSFSSSFIVCREPSLVAMDGMSLAFMIVVVLIVVVDGKGPTLVRFKRLVTRAKTIEKVFSSMGFNFCSSVLREGPNLQEST